MRKHFRTPTGVVLLNMGGPDSLDAVRPFLFNLFSDREIIRLGPALLQPLIAWFIARRRAPKSAESYRKIGGRSPINEITAAQASALEDMLSEQVKGERFLCSPGMRYWHPRTPDVLQELKSKGVERVVGLTLYPHYSRATTGSSLRDFEKAASSLGLNHVTVKQYSDHPDYIAALENSLRIGLKNMREKDFVLVYSAHNLPVEMIEQGDPYLDHVKATIAALEARTGIKGELCFQSRSGPVEWLEPTTEEMLNSLADQGRREILIMPISFVSDHVETLYEIDIQYGEIMKKRGVRLVRTPSLNHDEKFIYALSQLVKDALQEFD